MRSFQKNLGCHWMQATGRVPARTRRRFFALFALFLLGVQGGKGLHGQSRGLSEYDIKAGFIFNFTKFVEWPSKAFATPSSAISICVVGESLLTDPLSGAAADKVVNGRPILVKRVKATDDLQGCNLVFIPLSQQKYEARILDALKGMNVLIIGESPGFAEAGGTINFIVEGNRVKLEINLDAATHAGLKVSAKLLAVSRVIGKNSAAGGA